MGIKANFTAADINRMVERKRDLIEKAIVRRLQYLGEKCVNEARTNGAYTDRTGNLRSSIGYVVVVRGEIVNRNFVRGKSSTGQTTGIALAERLAAQISTGYALIVVAGMNYALYVEAKYALNVLNSAEQLAQRELPRLLEELKLKI